MHAWLVPSSYAPNLGGIEELTAQLAGELVRRGERVTVLTPRWPGRLPLEEDIGGIPVRRFDSVGPGLHPARLGAYPAGARRAASTLTRLGRAGTPDVVHVIGASWQAHHMRRFCTRHGLPLVMTLQGETVMDDHGLYQRGYRSLLIRRSLGRTAAAASAVTACSRWTIDQTRRLAALPAGVTVVPNGVDPLLLAPVVPVPPGGPILAYGRLVRNKGFDLLVEALEGTGRELWIGGSGPEERALRTLAAGSSVRTRFLGRLDRAGVRDALDQSTVVVMPSRLEPFGIVALEGMARARPVVASSIGGAAEFLAGGLTADPHHRADLRDAVELAASSPEMGRAGRERALTMTWPLVADRYIEIYRAVMR